MLPLAEVKSTHPLLYLSGRERECPKQVLRDFFEDTNLAEIRQRFDRILEACISADEGPFIRGKERSDLFHFLRKLHALLEANYLLAATADDLLS